MAGPITVFHLRCSPAYGGVETTIMDWLDNIDKSRFNCPLGLFKNKGGTEEEASQLFDAHGHEILYLPWGPRRQVFKAIDQLAEHLKNTGAQLLHTHDWRSDVVGYHAARRVGIPILVTIYVWFNRPLKMRLLELIDSRYIRHFDLVTSLDKATLKQTIERGVAPERTELLISGISEKRVREAVDRNAIRAQFGIAEDDIAFVYSARFYSEKAHANLLDAFKLALKRNPRLKLLLLGRGPLEATIRDRAVRLGIEDRVIMPGFITNVMEVLGAMDVMVHASFVDGLSLAICEGLLAGLPVIGSDVNGTPEVVIPGKTGWLVPPNDIPALVEKIVEASEYGDLRALGRQAKEFILTNFNIDIAIQRLQSVYYRLLGKTIEE